MGAAEAASRPAPTVLFTALSSTGVIAALNPARQWQPKSRAAYRYGSPVEQQNTEEVSDVARGIAPMH